ncbi:uncharacterized protein DC041_0009576 [Schistosoma bovis]|uniref:Uncharacterized protein n=2 Tax=Schistosoma TaxID=6181 RepID=A0A430QIM9_SCHBO|nr:uncharacterized protein DC041_0009576 [Schistosoma bovis]
MYPLPFEVAIAVYLTSPRESIMLQPYDPVSVLFDHCSENVTLLKTLYFVIRCPTVILLTSFLYASPTG